MKKNFLLVFLCLCTFMAGAQSADISVIPRPGNVAVREGEFAFDREKPLTVYIPGEAGDLMEMLVLKLAVPTGMKFTQVADPAKAKLRFIIDAEVAGGGEAYTLDVDKKRIEVRAPAYGGLFYGLQTLLQLMPDAVKSAQPDASVRWAVPCVSVTDSPRFGWRGMMLDVSRHFFTKEEVLKFIDELSEYKMNIFHWHLVDDQGWRIEIESLPRLTEIGAWRAERVGDWWSRERQREGEKATYGGFYTKADVKEVLEYARKRNVTVVPEIDVPGHSLEVLVAYPELACFKAPATVNVGNKFYGEDENSLCVGNEATFAFLEKVFAEVADLFPSEYIHIGADECYKGFWQKCPKCNARLKAEGLENTHQLQSYFVKRVEKMLQSHGKRLIGWDEILEGGLAPEATVMSWRGMSGGIQAAKEGHHVIMTPNEHCYLDLYQGEPTAEPNTYSMCRLSDSYAFEPVPDGVSPDLILGGQGNLWAESIPTFRHAEYMAWPRGWAISEVLWSSKENRDWDDFVARTETHFRRAEKADVNHARSVYNAIVTPYTDSDGKVRIELGKEIDDMQIYYTFDGTDPDHHAPVYSAPLEIPLNATRLRVITYRNGKPAGKLLSIETSQLLERAGNNKRVVGNL